MPVITSAVIQPAVHSQKSNSITHMFPVISVYPFVGSGIYVPPRQPGKPIFLTQKTWHYAPGFLDKTSHLALSYLTGLRLSMYSAAFSA